VKVAPSIADKIARLEGRTAAPLPTSKSKPSIIRPREPLLASTAVGVNDTTGSRHKHEQQPSEEKSIENIIIEEKLAEEDLAETMSAIEKERAENDRRLEVRVKTEQALIGGVGSSVVGDKVSSLVKAVESKADGKEDSRRSKDGRRFGKIYGKEQL